MLLLSPHGRGRTKDLYEQVLKALALVSGGIAGAAGYLIYHYSLFHSFASTYRYEAMPFQRKHVSWMDGSNGAKPSCCLAHYVSPVQRVVSVVSLTLPGLIGLLYFCSREAGGNGWKAWQRSSFFIFAHLHSAYYMWWAAALTIHASCFRQFRACDRTCTLAERQQQKMDSRAVLVHRRRRHHSEHRCGIAESTALTGHAG